MLGHDLPDDFMAEFESEGYLIEARYFFNAGSGCYKQRAMGATWDSYGGDCTSHS
jgi:hypothetical protein